MTERYDDDPQCPDTHDGEQCELHLGHTGDHMSHNDDWPAARQATGQADTEPVVAYWTTFPRVTIYCPEHGQDRPNLTPRTADDLPFGGNCTTCGRDVLIPAAEHPATEHCCDNCDGIDPDSCLFNPNRPKDPTTADDPIPLRWGHGDVLHGDDDTVTVCLSGPDREPYVLDLDPEKAAAFRDALEPPAACTCDAAGPAFVPAGHYQDCPQHEAPAPVVGQPAAAPDTEARAAAFNEAAAAAEGELLHDDTGTPEDEAYNQGVRDAITAIRRLAAGEAH